MGQGLLQPLDQQGAVLVIGVMHHPDPFDGGKFDDKFVELFDHLFARLHLFQRQQLALFHHQHRLDTQHRAENALRGAELRAAFEIMQALRKDCHVEMGGRAIDSPRDLVDIQPAFRIEGRLFHQQPQPIGDAHTVEDANGVASLEHFGGAARLFPHGAQLATGVDRDDLLGVRPHTGVGIENQVDIGGDNFGQAIKPAGLRFT